jgi:hypothetical protein
MSCSVSVVYVFPLGAVSGRMYRKPKIPVGIAAADASLNGSSSWKPPAKLTSVVHPSTAA